MKIINMGDYKMDDDDRRLQQLFASPALPDAGFSDKVMHRIRRRTLLRKWLVPAAMLVGGLIAVAPAITLLLDIAAGFPGVLGSLAESSGLSAVLQEGTTMTVVLALLCATAASSALLEGDV